MKVKVITLEKNAKKLKRVATHTQSGILFFSFISKYIL
jgi:hypothetical protein